MLHESDESRSLDSEASRSEVLQFRHVTSTHPYSNVIDDKTINFDSINEILNRVFKHESFRTELQRDAVVEACKLNRDMFVSLPTGSGKSLIYQLPALYQNKGLVIVVSPLVALISNQLANARKLGIPCASINSHMTKMNNSQVREELRSSSPKLRLVYITPETLCSDHFQPYLATLYRNKMLRMFAIDEAHCVSSWGHEFRPDYLKLGSLRAHYPLVPIVALTATATKKVFEDIVDSLKLDEPERVIASTFRKNLFYEVKNVEYLGRKPTDDLAIFINEYMKLGLNFKQESSGKKIKIAKELSQPEKESSFKKASECFAAPSVSSFSTAAKLLETNIEEAKLKRKRPSKKDNANPAILAKEPPKITSFFKPKAETIESVAKVKSDPVEVIDLCNDSIGDNKIADSRHNSIKEEDQDDCIEIIQEVKANQSNSIDKVRTSSEPQSITERKPQRNSPVELEADEESSSGGVGIVYCRTKITCEDVAIHLNSMGIKARAYHSGLTSKQRSEIEIDWMEERVLVICATISFGMGIDKSNVRFVVHFNMSQSLANYYQESGRAGRDGRPARCRLYYSSSDQSAIEFLIRKDMESESGGFQSGRYGDRASKSKEASSRAAMDRFVKMVDYCKGTSKNKCRHLQLAQEFALADESSLSTNGCLKSCDHCLRMKQLRDSGIDPAKTMYEPASGAKAAVAAAMAAAKAKAIAIYNKPSGGNKNFKRKTSIK